MSKISFPIALQITKIVQETATAKTYYLDNSLHSFSFQAGQFLTLNEDGNNPVFSRNYSISKAPFENEIAITIKRHENGYLSRLIFDRKQLGDKLHVIGVFGNFILPEKYDDKQFLLFAAGSGIVPLYALIKEILHNTSHPKIELYYSNRSSEETIYFKELNALVEKHRERLQIHYFFSQENNIHNARISAFMIPEIIQDADLKNVLAYLCGPIDYMDTIRMSLLTYGLPRDNAFTEAYSYYTEDMANRISPPPDTSARQVTITLNQETTTINVAYPESILDAALNQNVNLPYSCSSGQCGSCMTRIQKGKVWLGYNEVLTEQQIADGWTLTCMGFPITGDVEISYD